MLHIVLLRIESTLATFVNRVYNLQEHDVWVHDVIYSLWSAEIYISVQKQMSSTVEPLPI